MILAQWRPLRARLQTQPQAHLQARLHSAKCVFARGLGALFARKRWALCNSTKTARGFVHARRAGTTLTLTSSTRSGSTALDLSPASSTQLLVGRRKDVQLVALAQEASTGKMDDEENQEEKVEEGRKWKLNEQEVDEELVEEERPKSETGGGNREWKRKAEEEGAEGSQMEGAVDKWWQKYKETKKLKEEVLNDRKARKKEGSKELNEEEDKTAKSRKVEGGGTFNKEEVEGNGDKYDEQLRRAVAKADPTHNLMSMDGLLWCSACGAYNAIVGGRGKLLKDRCVGGRRKTQRMKQTLKSLDRGVHPSDGYRLEGRARRILRSL